MFLTNPLARPELVSHRYEHWRVLAEALGAGAAGPRQRSVLRTIPQKGKSWCIPARASRFGCGRWIITARLVERLRQQHFRVQVACDPDQQKWWAAAGETAWRRPEHVTELMGLIDRAGVVYRQRFRTGAPGRLLRGAHIHDLRSAVAFLLRTAAPAGRMDRGQALSLQTLFRLLPVCGAPLLVGPGSGDRLVAGREICSSPSRRAGASPNPRPLPPGLPHTEETEVHPGVLPVLMRGGEENSVARIATHLELAGNEVFRFWRASEEWRAAPSPTCGSKCRWRGTIKACWGACGS